MLRVAIVARLAGVFVSALACSANLSGATIEGRTIDSDGVVLEKVSVCLALASAPLDCERVKRSDKHGTYIFNGLKPGIDYLVTVNGDTAVSNRKFEQHANYVWQPRSQSVLLQGKKETRLLEDFVGKFNFSNFQRVVTLKRKDFPELSKMDLAANDVGLKVFIRPVDVDAPPQTIFLATVHDRHKLKIRASVPLATSAIEYEIFSAQNSYSGSIDLSERMPKGRSKNSMQGK